MITDYTGPSARRTPERGLSLPRSVWAYQPKLDGTYVQVRTDRTGRIIALHQRSGTPVQAGDARDFIGMPIAAPLAVLHAELEAQTEAGIRARETRGVPHLHVFDCSRMDGLTLADRSFQERYSTLHRWHAAAECYDGRGDAWRLDGQGNAHSSESGRFVRPARRNLARVPIVPLHRGPGSELWRRFVEIEGGEGVVACRLDAPIGKRGAKVKIKQTDTIDAVCIAVDRSAAVLSWAGHQFVVSALGIKNASLRPGVTVEVRHDGFYEKTVTPRFARIVRVRVDL